MNKDEDNEGDGKARQGGAGALGAGSDDAGGKGKAFLSVPKPGATGNSGPQPLDGLSGDKEGD